MSANTGHSDGTVGKALDVLEAVAVQDRPVRFSDLLSSGRWPKATLYRLLQTLTNQGMLHYDDETGTYAPGLRLVQLAHRAWNTTSIAPVARPYIDQLSAHLGKTVHLATLDHGQVLYLDKRNAAKPIRMFSDAGKVGPAYCTGVGKAMLAFLPEPALDAALRAQAFASYTPQTLTSATALRDELAHIRAAGLSFDREEHEPGIICIAAPIRAATGEALGAISVTTSTLQNTLEDLSTLGPDLQDTARDISAALHPWSAEPRKGADHGRHPDKCH
ncbi:MAG: IclR family transcriptional regulator [Pseudomonadota bacterium]